ncbi:MAG: ABC transporter substrate-binding protein [Candidatus Tectomicrobia bacterium]|nr:ABC transporter substrate-binding protein [Candidatus Tectomicrobia bacterium]
MGRESKTIRRMAIAATLAVLIGSETRALAQAAATYCAAWIISPSYAPLVAAVEKGFFKAEGLDVKYVRGHGSSDTFKRVGLGSCDIGQAAAGAAVLGRAKGVRGKLVAMMSHKLEETLYFFADSGIHSPKDLEGKRVTGGPKASSNSLMFPLFARANGVDASKVQMVYMTPGAVISSLASGKVDATIAYHRMVPNYEKAAGQIGKKIKMIVWADNGLDLYSEGIVASDENIATKGDLIVRFLRGQFRGMADSLRDPEGAVELLVKRHPGHSPQASLANLRLVQEFWFDRLYEKEGLGHINPRKMAGSIEATLKVSGIEKTLAPEDVMTNQFIDQLPRELRFPRK